MGEDNKKRRAVFTLEDEAILMELVSQSNSVVNNHKTGGTQPQMKKNVSKHFNTFMEFL